MQSPSDILGDSDGAAAFDAIAAAGPVEVGNQMEVAARSASPFTISRKDGKWGYST